MKYKFSFLIIFLFLIQANNVASADGLGVIIEQILKHEHTIGQSLGIAVRNSYRFSNCELRAKQKQEDSKKSCKLESEKKGQIDTENNDFCEKNYAINEKQIKIDCKSFDYRLNQCIDIKVNSGLPTDAAKKSCNSDVEDDQHDVPVWYSILKWTIVTILLFILIIIFKIIEHFGSRVLTQLFSFCKSRLIKLYDFIKQKFISK